MGLCLGLTVLAVQAETWALLVGVGAVKALPPRLWLRGPGHDVALMRQTLVARGLTPAHIRVLTDQPQGAGPSPTLEAIRAAMTDMLRQLRPGDHVLLHLAGHGVQVPQARGHAPAEPDGLDEVFLTADVEPWHPPSERLPQGLYDDEIGAWMDRVVDRGATVALLADTCHAAGMARSDADRTWVRSVPAAELGVPAFAPVPPRGERGSPAGRTLAVAPRRLDGRVMLLAARSHEATPEAWLPREAGLKHARVHGVFTFALAASLADGHTTAAAVLGAVRQRYAAERRTTPVPQLQGDPTLPVLPAR